MTAFTSHVLDVAIGTPAAGIEVRLVAWSATEQRVIGHGHTDAGGRLAGLGPEVLGPGTYLVRFEVAEYFRASAREALFPEVVVTLTLTEPTTHLHVPLLITPNSYSVYRGS